MCIRECRVRLTARKGRSGLENEGKRKLRSQAWFGGEDKDGFHPSQLDAEPGVSRRCVRRAAGDWDLQYVERS